MGVLIGFFAAAVGLYVGGRVYPQDAKKEFILGVTISLLLGAVILLVMGLTGLLF